MKIALGADHRGAALVKSLIQTLEPSGHEVRTLGPIDETPRDYPDAAGMVARAVADGQADRGILVCGSGIGVSIAANKIPGIRAALVHDEEAAALSRRHNDANILCLAADRLVQEDARAIVRVWLETDFEGGRHQRRVEKIAALEERVPCERSAS